MIRIGHGRGGLELDAAQLAGSCGLIQGTRGSGKSYLARVIVEQTIPEGLQTIVIDPEGEYTTLREKCDLLIAGEGGDVPCEVRSARVLAQRIAELRCSAVMDLAAMAPDEQDAFTATFVTALNRLPKRLEGTRLVVIDEAHRFCPEPGHGRPAQASDPITMLMSQGRKRGLGALLLTQRLSKLRKDAAAEAATIFICRTNPIDIKRARDLLGITPQEATDLRKLESGTVMASGPALSELDVVTAKVRKASTTHPEPGARFKTATPPPKGEIRKLLKELADLPPSLAEEEASSLEAANKRIQELEKQVSGRPVAEDLQALEGRALEAEGLAVYWEGQCGEIHDAWTERWASALAKLDEVGMKLQEIPQAAVPAPPSSSASTSPRPHRPAVSAKLPPPRAPERAKGTNGSAPGGRFRVMLHELALHGRLSRKALAHQSGMSRKSSGFRNYLSEGKKLGYWTPSGDGFAITDRGRAEAGATDPLPRDPAALVEYWCRTHVTGRARDMLRTIVAAGRRGIGREALAEQIGMSVTSSGFRNYLSTLRTLGLISKSFPACASEELLS